MGANSAGSAADLAAKVKEDPLFLIKKQEEEARKRLASNPVKMKQLQQVCIFNTRVLHCCDRVSLAYCSRQIFKGSKTKTSLQVTTQEEAFLSFPQQVGAIVCFLIGILIYNGLSQTGQEVTQTQKVGELTLC